MIAASGIPENSFVQIVQVQSSTLCTKKIVFKMFSGRFKISECSVECSAVIFDIYIYLFV